MNIELVVFEGGNIMLAADEYYNHIVKRVEYYREQKLFLIVYQNPDHEGELMEMEVSDKAIPFIEKSPSVIVCTLFKNNDPVGYKVPLIKVGNVF
jgi:hypothetical protein